MIEERPADFVPLHYGQSIRGSINWRDRKTGANKQSNGQFTLYNDYYFDAQRSDDVVIRFTPINPPASSRWSVELNEAVSFNTTHVIPLKQTKVMGELRPESRLPVSGRYHILVKYTDVAMSATTFSGTYALTATTSWSGAGNPLPTPAPTAKPAPTIVAANPASFVQRCSENVKAGDWVEARKNCKRALDLNGAVLFDIKTPKYCWDRIDPDDLRDLSKEPVWQFEIQPGRVEIKGKPAKYCFDPTTLKNMAEIWVFLQKDMKDANQREQFIIDIREFKLKGDLKSEGRTYHLYPASKNLEEARLIRELIDTYFIKKRQ